MTGKGIHKKMVAVMRDVRSAPKTGDVMGRYSYHEKEDALVIRPALAKHGISFSHCVIDHQITFDVTPKGEHMIAVTVQGKFTCIDDGSSVDSIAVGVGMGKRDEIASKAQTNALKNLLLSQFLLGDHDYGDAGSPPAPESSEPKEVRVDSGSRKERADDLIEQLTDFLVGPVGISEESADRYLNEHLPTVYSVDGLDKVTPTQLAGFVEAMQGQMQQNPDAIIEKITNRIKQLEKK